MATIFPTTTVVHTLTVTDSEGEAADADTLVCTVTEGLGSSSEVVTVYTYGVGDAIEWTAEGTYTLTYDATVGGAYKVVGVVTLDGNTRTWRITYTATAP